MATVELIDVTKVYDDKIEAVKNANLSIKDKEFVVLVGPSGCGKSTLLRMIAGLEDITRGIIKIDNKVVNDVPPKDRDIAMVFQNYALYPHMTVYENMAFGLKLRKFPKNEIEKRVQQVAEILGLKEFLDRKPKALSGGQRQRVALGRAIVRQPKVFLFDEPLSNLDAKLRVQMRIEIKKLHQKLGVTMIYVTHDQVEAMTMGDRIVVLNNGIIQQVDTPLNLYNHPRNAFVAGFIGSPSMNFFNGEIINEGNLKFITDSFSISIDSSLKNKLINQLGNEVIMGVRPEHIKIKNENYNSDFGFIGELEVFEPMGNDTFAYFKVGNFSCTVRSSSYFNFKVGEKVFLELAYDHIHFFDRNSGQSLT